MAATFPRRAQLGVLLASLALAGTSAALAGNAPAGGGDAPPGAAAQPARRSAPTRPLAGKNTRASSFSKTAPVSVDAARFELDYGTHHLIFHQPVISQNDLRISAERADATGLDFQNSRWIFTGAVHLTSEYRGKLDSDEAVVEFRDNQMQSAVATGHPAQFEQTNSTTGVLARGHADNIQYEVAAATIRLTSDAWLKYGDNGDITAPVLLYNIREQRLEGGPGGAGRPGQRVHLIIVPKKGASIAPRAGARPPAKAGSKGKSESRTSSASQSSSGSQASSAQGPTP